MTIGFLVMRAGLVLMFILFGVMIGMICGACVGSVLSKEKSGMDAAAVIGAGIGTLIFGIIGYVIVSEM